MNMTLKRYQPAIQETIEHLVDQLSATVYADLEKRLNSLVWDVYDKTCKDMAEVASGVVRDCMETGSTWKAEYAADPQKVVEYVHAEITQEREKFWGDEPNGAADQE